MTWNRREVLGSLGLASAHALLFGFGCGAKANYEHQTAHDPVDELRGWLRRAVEMLAHEFPSAHALAVMRRRTTAARDVLGGAVARAYCEGVVLTVRDRSGRRREQVTSDLTRDGVATAAAVLGGGDGRLRPPPIDFGVPQRLSPLVHDPRALGDAELLARVDALVELERERSSRIVYAATSLDIDDAHVWSIMPGHDREQRIVRIREAAVRVAWNGTRPIVSEVSRSWAGGELDHALDAADLATASRGALELATPASFADGDHGVVLEPSVAAQLIDAAVRALLTTTAVRRPEVARRLALGASVASELVTVTDDPLVPGAYGGFAFDDEGTPAAAVTLLDRGRVVGRLADAAGVAAGLATVAGRGQRPGHVAAVEAEPSHIRVAAGSTDRDALLDDGFILEGGVHASVDPASDHVLVAVQRAREVRGGQTTGRLFADIELSGELGGLLAAITAVGNDVTSLGIRDERGGQPRWRSIETPSLRSRAALRAMRRPT